MSTNAPQTRHAVTAIVIAHDGARWLPGLVQALRAQTYPVEQTVAVDTGSRDRSGAVLAELIGQDSVFGMDRSTGYGEAVEVALRHAAKRRSGRTDPNINRVDWIWLLHDDCEPAPDALERLLRAASRDRSVAVLGPKVLDGQDRRTLREAGISIDRAGRRITGIEPGEIDQGQHDHRKAVLAVGSAGMLVRRDVWEQVGGFDTRLKLFRDDVDFCWRVQGAGYRVQVVTDAVLYHRELSARRRRPVEYGNARRIDRRNALFVLAVNLPLLPMLRIVGGSVAGSLVRAAYFLLTKQLDLAAAHAFAVAGLFGHPVRLFQGRRRRARGRAEGYAAVRQFILPARTLFRLAENIAGLVSNGPPQASDGRHQASAEESEEDEQFVDTQSVVRRIIGHPGVQLFVSLLIVSLAAERRLLGTSPLGGGALVPAWGGASALWHEYLAGFHAVGVGSTASAPPYLAVVAALGTVLGGQAWLAVDVLLLGCVPLAGLTAYLASRLLVTATPARVLLAASYALLPVASGAVAAGRLGTAVAFIVLPLAAVSAGRMLTAAPRQARRAAWATGLLVALAAAFAPLAWVLGVAFAVAAVAVRRWLVAGDPVNALIVAVVPFLLLFPWSLHLLGSPSAFLSEAGLSAQGLTTARLSPAALLALSPGGPGLPPLWVTAGFALALLATVLPARRTGMIIAGWATAIAGLLTAVLVSRASVTPAAGGQPAAGWPGVALAVAALGLLVASAPAAQWLAMIIPNGSGNLPPAPGDPQPQAGPAGGYGRSRRLLACVALAAAATAPLLVAVYWVKDGVRGPVGSISAPLLPAFVSASSTAASGPQYRTVILRPADGTSSGGGSGLVRGGLDYLVVRQGDPTLGEPELAVAPAAQAALSREVAALAAPDGADAGDPGLVLGDFGIRYVLLPGPVDPVLAQRLDAALGLVALSKAPTYDLWQVTGPVARARVVAADGTTTALASGTVSMSGASAPASGGTLVLAEPYGGWTAKLNGRALTPVKTPVDGWAQGFVLPAGGGKLSLARNDLARVASLVAELLALLVICVLALPGKRADPVEEAEALAALREARQGRRAAGTAGRGERTPRSAGTGRRAALASAAAGAGRLGLARKRLPGRRAVGADDETFDTDNETGTLTTAADDAMAVTASAAGLDPAGGGSRRGTGTSREPWDMTGDWVARSAEQADARASESRSTGSRAAGSWDPGDPWTDDDLGATTQWARRDSGSQPQAQDGETGATTGRRRQDGWGTSPRRAPGEPETESPLSSNGTQPHRAWENSAWDSGPQQPVSATGSRPAASSDGQPRYAWDSGPQRRVSPTGSQPGVPGGDQSRDSWPSGPQRSLPGTGPQPATSTGGQPRYPWRSGPQRSVPETGSQPAAPNGGQPRDRWQSGPQRSFPGTGSQPAAPTGDEAAQRAPWESPDWGADSGWGATTDRGAAADRDASNDWGASPEREDSAPSVPEPGTGSGPWPVASRPARSERGSHRASKHGKPSRWRGAGDRSGGES
ncbi:glycosyltransferase [Trebonia kvetii]|uniref:Glycosyltransferase n=1 Tax=Trebonia kvetii TaxID=2480626 RepID=A0A6P2C795_9ACTN|nr:glycosyltransferase family 2 protein [Trebonia kvetii]TVZ07090.1 glycosyltransferase [Trebonia kvetii]